MLGTGNQTLQRREHLAAVADTQRETVGTCKERLEVGAHCFVEQNRLGPTLAGSQHVTVGEAAAGDDSLEFLKWAAPREQVSHVHIVRNEACPLEHGRRLDLTVDTLLTEYGNRRPGPARNKRRSNVFLRIEVQ